jgi:type IV pilus assembly protein PilA
MIVVAIIGILAAIAIPAYQDYVIRTIVAEGLQLAAGAKVAFMEHYVTDGYDNMPRVSYPGIGKPPDGSYNYEFTPTDNVAKIYIQRFSPPTIQPNIRIHYGGKNKKLTELGLVVTLSPGFGGLKSNGYPLCRFGEAGCDDKVAGSIVWGCTLSSQINRTFGELARYLPSRCRYKGSAT